MDILVLVGSLRRDSWTGQVAEAIAELLPEGVDARVYDGLGSLPHYDQDLDGDHTPESVVAFREAVASADALVVATPEYNGSVTGVLKNAIDWASRPRGSGALDGKPAAVVSVSPSPRGAQWAREDLVKILRVAGADPARARRRRGDRARRPRGRRGRRPRRTPCAGEPGRLPRRGRARERRLTFTQQTASSHRLLPV